MKLTSFRYCFILCCMAVAALAFTACDKEDDIQFWKPVYVTTDKLEIPKLKEGNTHVQHFTTVNGKTIMNYCYEYDASRGHSRWVAFRFDANTRKKDISRSPGEPFADDPQLPESMRIGSNTFSGYTRGHICASADRLYQAEANIQTFYMSNMSPMEWNFNSYYWVAFEQWVQGVGRKPTLADTVYVCKGGYIEESGLSTLWRSNGMKVVVPKHYFIAVLSCKNNKYNSIGFWVEHDAHGHTYYMSDSETKTVLSSHVKSVNELETLTGIDFFPGLPDDQEEMIENYKNIDNWN